jgi:hypothetical protein
MGFFDLFRRPGADRDKVAIEINVAAGVLEECPVCRALTDRGHDNRLAAADVLAHERFDAGDASVAIFGEDRDDLLLRLRSIRKRFPFDCICQSSG